MLSPLAALSRAEARLALPRLATSAQALRLPVLIVALADVVTGAAVSGALPQHPLALAGLASAAMLLRRGAVAIAHGWQDRAAAPAGSAAWMGLFLIATALACAAAIGAQSLAWALALAAVAVLYETNSRQVVIGPLLLALTHGLTLLLGMSVSSIAFANVAYVVAVPVLYVMAAGVLRRDLASATQALLALIVLLTALVALLTLLQASPFGHFALPFIALLAFQTVPSFACALADPHPDAVADAHRCALFGIVVVNAALAAAFAGPWLGLAVLALRPLLSTVTRRCMDA